MATIEKGKALDVVRQMVEDGQISQEVAEKYFPELKESEDERIRKAIHIPLDWLDGRKDYAPKGEYTIRDMIAWLDRQGKHQKFRDSIQVGDKVTRNEDGVLVNLSQLKRVTKKDEKQGKQKSIDKVEPKFREGDMIIHKELGGDYIHSPHKIIQVDILDKKYRLEGGLVAHFGEQDDYELVEQKPAWSEEDEKKIDFLVNLIRFQVKDSKYSFGYGDNVTYVTKDEAIDMLKSLRPQPHWKPSDEQMKFLWKYAEQNNYDGRILTLLYNDLKKLKV